VNIFPEVSADFEAVSALLESAFGRPREARLVEALRKTGRLAVALAGFDRGGTLAGHVALSVVSVEPKSGGRMLGLGPVAVLPHKRRKGFGAALVKAALRAAKEAGFEAVFVLGDPAYYGRLGFTRADAFGLACGHDAPQERFLALELVPGALEAVRGTVRYAPQFGTALGA
jgi:putative acetyltransferase